MLRLPYVITNSSVCYLSVCDIGAPYADGLNVLTIFLHHLIA